MALRNESSRPMYVAAEFFHKAYARMLRSMQAMSCDYERRGDLHPDSFIPSNMSFFGQEFQTYVFVNGRIHSVYLPFLRNLEGSLT